MEWHKKAHAKMELTTDPQGISLNSRRVSHPSHQKVVGWIWRGTDDKAEVDGGESSIEAPGRHAKFSAA